MSSVGPKPKGQSVRALARGLAILRYVNQMIAVSPGEIARALDIPRPTVYRLLETLEELGYVAVSPTSNCVRVTRIAAGLSDGHALTNEICQAAGPLFAHFSERLVWPLDLSIYHNAAMIIQETTHDRSPLSLARYTTGYALPVLRTSPGRAYLAFCPDEEREFILDRLRRLGSEEDQPFLDPRWLRHMVEETRTRGVAVRDGNEFQHGTASLAVPICSDGSVLGCVSLVWIRSALSTGKALDDFSAPLKEIAQKISRALPG